MARPLKPLVKSGGYYPSNRWTPLVYPGGYTTANGGGQPEPEAVLKTVTGSLIHITNALALPAKALSVAVEPIQDLNGYDNPWPAGGGKNKGYISADNIYSQQNCSYTFNNGGVVATSTGNYGRVGFSFPVVIGETYTVSANCKRGESAVYKVGLGSTSNWDTEYGTLAANPNITTTLTQFTKTITATTSTLYVEVYPSSNAGAEITVENFQCELGSSATSYSPYSNICPISGRTSATVTRTGKNLVNKADGNQASNNWFIGSNRVNTGADGSFMLNAGTYTFSVSDTPSGMYVSNSSNVNIKTAYDVPQITFSISERMPIKLNIYKSGSTSEYWNALNIQLELGSTASAYEPYQGNTYTIQLGDTVYGGTLDVVTGVLTVDRGYGQMTYSYLSGLSSDYIGYSVITGRGPMIWVRNWKYSEIAPRKSGGVFGICNAFPVSIHDNDIFASQYRIYFSVGDNITSVNDFLDVVQALEANGSGLFLCYELASPIEITLTPTQIDMLLGENNLWADAGDSTLTYYADGNASTSEALGILLGGTYNNPGGADDASDDEALGILLGGS